MKEKSLNSFYIDFDQTICNTHFNPRTGNYDMGEPMPLIIDAVNNCAKAHEIVIFTARPVLEHDQVQTWLVEHKIDYNMITNIKKPAIKYVDDKSMTPDVFIGVYGKK